MKQVCSGCKMRSIIQNITLSFTTVLVEGVLYLFILHQLFESGGRRKMDVDEKDEQMTNLVFPSHQRRYG